MNGTKKGRIAAALLLSLLLAGSGQIYQGRVKKGIAVYCAILLLLCMWPTMGPLNSFGGLVAFAAVGFGIQIFALVDAVHSAVKGNEECPEAAARPGWLRRAATIATAAVIVVVAEQGIVRSTSTRAYIIRANSMAPTVLSGDRVIANLNYYQGHRPKRGDAVLVRTPYNELLVKRVIAEGGDLIQGKDGDIYLNGGRLDEPYAIHVGNKDRGRRAGWLDAFGPIPVPKDEFFVIGDNRDNSYDSRSPDFGPVGLDAIKGKPLYIYWSKDKSRIGRRIR